MPKRKDYTGQKFNKLTFIAPSEQRKGGKLLWELQCECGKTTYQDPYKVVNSLVKSCGCSSHIRIFNGKVPIGPRKDYTGQKFGMLTFIKCFGKGTDSHYQWELVCDCGETTYQVPWQVVNGIVRSCGCTQRGSRKDYAGQKIASLTFVRETDKRQEQNGYVIWECLCECGNAVYTVPREVVIGVRKSCGCHLKKLIASGGGTPRKYDPRISSARAIFGSSYRDCKFEFELFLAISQQDCAYCGRSPHRVWNKYTKNDSVYQRENGNFTYNGMDRLDSSKGHTIDNVVPCCSTCNWMKRNMTLHEWFDHIERLHARIQTNGGINRFVESLFDSVQGQLEKGKHPHPFPVEQQI